MITASALSATELARIRAGAWRVSMLPQLMVICPVQDTQDALLRAGVLSQLFILHSRVRVHVAPKVLKVVRAHLW